MRRLSRRHILSRLVLFGAVVAALVVLWPVRRLHSENFVFYLPNQRRLIPIWTAGGTPYLPVLPVLTLTGQLGMVLQKRNSVEVYVGGIPLKMRRDETKVQAGQFTITLQQPILRANGEWLAPTSFLSVVLPSLVGQQIVYRPGTYRAFLRGVRPISFAVRLQALPSRARLIITFTSPVSIQTAATNGQWIIYLGGAPIQPMEQDFFFQNPYLTKVRFDDQDGRPKLILTPSQTGLDFYPRVAQEGEVLTADVVSPNGPLGTGQHGTPPPVLPAHPVTAPGVPATRVAPPALPAVVLDAGHGGADSGARSQDGMLEKNLTLQVAGFTNTALSATKRFRVVLTRPGDADSSFEQRTITANTAHPLAFLSFHAGELGDRTPVIVIYTYTPSEPLAADPRSPSPLFIPWESAQTAEELKSEGLANALQKQFAQIPGLAGARVLRAPVRQLRSVDAPAVAIELGTLAPAEKAGELARSGFQEQVANAITAAIEQFATGGTKP